MDISDLYDTFFINSSKEFKYNGCPNEKVKQKLKSLIKKAVKILHEKNNGKYIIKDDLSNFEPADV